MKVSDIDEIGTELSKLCRDVWNYKLLITSLITTLKDDDVKALLGIAWAMLDLIVLDLDRIMYKLEELMEDEENEDSG